MIKANGIIDNTVLQRPNTMIDITTLVILSIYVQYYRGRLFSVAVARGGRYYGLEHPRDTVDVAPRGSRGDLTFSGHVRIFNNNAM